MQLDIVAPKWSLVVEYDGRRWHAGASKFEHDRTKTLHMEAEGWTVVRARDRLDAIGDRDVCVDSTDGTVKVVKALLRRLMQLGFHTDAFDEYLRGSELWAARQANREYQRVLSRSLASEHPGLAAQLDPDRNDEARPEAIHPGSNERYRWRCPGCAHTWRASVSSRVGSDSRPGTGCPLCSKRSAAAKRSVPAPGESLAVVGHEVVDAWRWG